MSAQKNKPRKARKQSKKDNSSTTTSKSSKASKASKARRIPKPAVAKGKGKGKASKKKAAPKAALKKKSLRTAERACGILLFQSSPVPSVLVLWRKDGSPDLPKGGVEPGETDRAAALRETWEETGIAPHRIHLTDDFAFENTYPTRNRRSGHPVDKTVRLFHGVVEGPVQVVVQEHRDYAWLRMADPEERRAAVDLVADNPTFQRGLVAWGCHIDDPAVASLMLPYR